MLQYSPTAAALHCNNGVSIQSIRPPLSILSLSKSSSLSSFSLILSPLPHHNLSIHVSNHCYSNTTTKLKRRMKITCSQYEPLKVMISGAPASGKGTQCEMIVQKFGLVHISTGDLLRSEVSAATEIGNRAKEYMSTGRLVPDEIVIAMVMTRLSQKDAKERGWLLDGFPRSSAQAQRLEKLKIRPDVFIVLDVPDEVLVERCVDRRLDPVTGKIYHIKNFPPETEEIKQRLISRSDDTEEKVKSRLQIYKQNFEAIISTYSDLLKRIDGDRSKDVIFKDIASLLSEVQKKKVETMNSGKLQKQKLESSATQETWRGIPTRLNNIPHSREIRDYFYNDVLKATQRAINAGKTRLKVEINIPELNPNMDVYRIGTLMELVRVLSLSFADDGKRVKVCVQGSMGQGALAGMPLQLAGTRKILEFMDWGEYGAMGTFINIGSIGAKEVSKQDDMFILVAPQNAMGNCIIDDLQAMTNAAGDRPVILINPRLKDLPASSGIMQTMGRDKRLAYAATFENCYLFRLLYYAGTQYPIMGALRFAYPFEHELYKRVDESPGKENYVLLSTFSKRPTSNEINDAFDGKSRNQVKKEAGFWGFLTGVF